MEGAFHLMDVITGAYTPRVRISIQRFAPFLHLKLHSCLHTPGQMNDTPVDRTTNGPYRLRFIDAALGSG